MYISWQINLIQIKFRIMINVYVKAKIQEKVCAKKVIFGIQLHAGVKIVDIQEEKFSDKIYSYKKYFNKFYQKRVVNKMKNSCILLAFPLIITMTLLIDFFVVVL